MADQLEVVLIKEMLLTVQLTEKLAAPLSLLLPIPLQMRLKRLHAVPFHEEKLVAKFDSTVMVNLFRTAMYLNSKCFLVRFRTQNLPESAWAPLPPSRSRKSANT